MKIEYYSGCKKEELNKMFDDQTCDNHNYTNDDNQGWIES